MSILERLRRWASRRRGLEARMEEEMHFHLEMEARRNVDAGMPPEEGRRAALVSFGGVEQMKELCRERRGLAWLDDAARDLRFGARMLAKAPGFTAAVVLTLALGIGACAAIFSVVDGVLLRPPPFPEPDRVVLLEETVMGEAPDALVASANYHDLLREIRGFQGLAATTGGGMTLNGAGVPVRLKGLRITASALPVLGIQPLLGRNFRPEEEPDGQVPPGVAILSHGLWQRQFGGRPEAVGSSIQLSGKAVTIIGVLPGDTGIPDGNGVVDQQDVEIYTPLGFTESQRHEYRGHWLKVFGRLAPGVTMAQVHSELAAVAARLAPRQPLQRGWGLRLQPLMDAVVGRVRPVLLALLGAVGCLLLIACANVASLLLARATARSTELAVRAAVGASRGRMVRQLLVESLLLALLGAGLGLLLARGAVVALLALAPEALPRARAIAIDGRALAFTMGLALFTGAGFGLAPALQSMRTDPHEILKRGATEGRRRHRLRGALVVGEIAIALVLLAGAGLLMRSFFRLAQVSPGFDPRDALTVRLNLDDSHQAMAQPAIFVQGVTERLAALPGVQAVAVAARFPFAENPLTIPFSIAGRPEVTEGDRPITNHYQVGPDYFRAMRIPILRGRAFGPGDVDGAHRVAVVSQSLARRYFAAEDPLGKTITIFGPPSEIVGIAGDVRVDRLDGEPSPQSYQPFAQVSWTKANFVIRTAGPAAGYIEPVRAAIARLDRDVPVYNVRTFSTLVASSIARQRFAMILFAVFSGVALLLAAVGIYGVMSYWVSQRRGEIGIRMALGAHTGAVLRMVLAQGSRLIGLGLVIGLVGALLLTKFLERLLYQLSARDPLTFAAMVALLAATAATACLLPARRAARVDPMKVLRAE